ncbi:prepilin-type N-terminal cleavage/methylation domain-containing protein [Luteimonas yindakuii]|uniref:prepilin-type N-terminal cleavage/methylation domain-containing protein n=1 Tax=Luteimonas yindakuii TaxID=2565782 RepID=UPI0010A32E18|nr:prepilin-type N-terminal cleavage/methylation domain-containing protein [Luteimonas yindakuii]QCO67071.1 prepilin-type N-terminal cleavage/methylation domain-containing protein [Luteimonas yindakuii]
MRPDQRGFSLLEAVVALAILAAAGLALFAAMSQSMQMVGRAEDSRTADAAMRNALAWVEQLNPTESPKGELQFPPYTVSWTSTLLEPARPSATGYLAPGLHDVGLHRLQLTLRRDGALIREFDVRKVGYRQVRAPAEL